MKVCFDYNAEGQSELTQGLILNGDIINMYVQMHNKVETSIALNLFKVTPKK